MADMEILNQLIKASARLEIVKEYDKFTVTLEEPQETDSFATIRNLPYDAVVIKVDEFKSPDDIFQGANGECRRADYVIISEEKKRIVYIELKKTKDAWHKIVKQLLGAQCFIKYCKEVGKSFWNEDGFLHGYEQRFISIGHTGIAKKRTRIIRKTATHDTAEKAMKVDWPHHLQFNHLAGA